jgi:hypothetical protein
MYRQYSYSPNSSKEDTFQVYVTFEKECLKSLKVYEINTEEFIPIVRNNSETKNFDPIDYSNFYKHFNKFTWTGDKSDKNLSTYPISFFKVSKQFDDIAPVKYGSKMFDFLRTLPNFSKYCEEYIKEQEEQNDNKEHFIYCCKLGKIQQKNENTC